MSQYAAMAIIAVLFMALAHILPTILNNVYLLALCKGGVLSRYIITSVLSMLTSHIRCCAPADKFNSHDKFTPQSHIHTAALTDAFSLQELWDGYGIVGDIVIRIFLLAVTEC